MSFDFRFAAAAGGSEVLVRGVATDASGNVYVTGTFRDTVDFDPTRTHTQNADILTSQGSVDTFVVKYARTGTFRWVRHAGSSSEVQAEALAVDDAGNVFITGSFFGSVTFNVDQNGQSFSAPGRGNVFVWQLDTNGNHVRAVQAGSTIGHTNRAHGIALDPAGNVYITGFFSDVIRFPGTPNLDTGFRVSAFVAKMNPSGSFEWSRALRQTGTTAGAYARGNAIAVDQAGHVVVVGEYRGTVDLNPRAESNEFTSASANLPDMFLVRLTPGGNFRWGQSIGSTGRDQGLGLAIDASNSIYVTGRFSGEVDFDPTQSHPNNADRLSIATGHASFVAKYTSGGRFLWTRRVGQHTLADFRVDVALDGAGQPFVFTSFVGRVTLAGTAYTSTADHDTILVRYTSTGLPVTAVQGTSSGRMRAQGIDYSADLNRIVLAGNYRPTAQFTTTALPQHGETNLFAAQYRWRGETSEPSPPPSPPPPSPPPPSPPPPEQRRGLAHVDYDGDGRADIAAYRSATAEWLIRYSGGGAEAIQFGAPVTDMPVPGDYNGNRRTNLAVFRPGSAEWFIRGVGAFQFGAPIRDIPVPGDYTGNNTTDLAVFRPGSAEWFIRGVGVIQFGGPNDIPVPADYTGNGRIDLAVFRPGSAEWFIRGVGAFQFGGPNDRPIPADYTGNGRADLAVFRPNATQENWFIRGVGAFRQGEPGDIPIPADYTGNNRAERGVFQPTTAQWVIQDQPTVTFGARNMMDHPLPVPLVYRYMGGLGPMISSASTSASASASTLTSASDSKSGTSGWSESLGRAMTASFAAPTGPTFLVAPGPLTFTKQTTAGDESSSPDLRKNQIHDRALADLTAFHVGHLGLI